MYLPSDERGEAEPEDQAEEQADVSGAEWHLVAIQEVTSIGKLVAFGVSQPVNRMRQGIEVLEMILILVATNNP
jgi:hypothetical protein